MSSVTLCTVGSNCADVPIHVPNTRGVKRHVCVFGQEILPKPNFPVVCWHSYKD